MTSLFRLCAGLIYLQFSSISCTFPPLTLMIWGGGFYAQSLYLPFIHLTKTDWKCTTCQEMCAVHGWCMNEAQPYPHEADSVTFPNTSCSICTPLPWAYSPWWALSSWAQSTFCHLSNVVQLSGRGAISITHSNRKMQISCGDKTFRLL